MSPRSLVVRYGALGCRIACTLALAVVTARVLSERLTDQDTDLFWHLASGRFIMACGQLHARDPFAYTSTDVWLNCEWLFDICVFEIHRIGGYAALGWARIVLGFVNVGLLVWLIVRCCPIRLSRTVAVGVASALAAVWIELVRPMLWLRPHVVGYAAFVAFLLLYFEAMGGRMRAVRFVPSVAMLMLVWVNFHASFSIGLGILGASTLWEVVCDLKRDRRLGPTARTLGAGLLAATACCCITPQGIESALHPLYYLRDNVFAQTMAEMQATRLDTHAPWLQILAGLDVAVLIGLLWRRRLDHFALLLLLSFYGLHHFRHVPVTALFMLSLAVAFIPPFEMTAGRSAIGIAGWVLSAVLVVLLAQDFRRLLPAERVFAWEDFPVDAVVFMRDNPLPGAIYNPFEWGGWLEWVMPGKKVFIDGRNEIAFSTDTYLDYLRIMQSPSRRMALIDRYGIHTVLINRRFEEYGLKQALQSRSDWRLMYEDDIASVLVKADPDQLQRLMRRLVGPSGPFNEARLGKEALRNGQAASALAHLRASVDRYPYDTTARVNLGVALMWNGQPQAAVDEWERTLVDDPTTLKAHYFLGVYYRNQHDVARAAREFRAELALDPTSRESVKALEDLDTSAP